MVSTVPAWEGMSNCLQGFNIRAGVCGKDGHGGLTEKACVWQWGGSVGGG